MKTNLPEEGNKKTKVQPNRKMETKRESKEEQPEQNREQRGTVGKVRHAMRILRWF